MPTKATSVRQPAERGDGVLADGGLGGAADPAGQQVQVDVGEARQPGRDRHGVGDDRRAAGRGAAAPASRAVVVPASSSTLPPLLGQLGRARPWRSGPSRSALGEVAVGDGELEHAQRRGGDGAAVHAADETGTLQGGEVAAHGLGGDRRTASARSVTDSRPRWASRSAMACWRSSAYTGLPPASVGDGIFVSVVLCPNLLTVKGWRGLHFCMTTITLSSTATRAPPRQRPAARHPGRPGRGARARRGRAHRDPARRPRRLRRRRARPTEDAARAVRRRGRSGRRPTRRRGRRTRQRRRRRGAHRDRRASPGTRGCARRCASGSTRGEPLLAALHGGRRPVRRRCSPRWAA